MTIIQEKDAVISAIRTVIIIKQDPCCGGRA